MEDGYVQELFKLFRESQYVQPPKKPIGAYERFVGNYEQACKDKSLNHNSEQAKRQWENLEKELKDEYFRLSKKDDELYEKLLRQYHSISNLIKKKKADGSVSFFQEKGVDRGLTNLQQLWDELSIEEKQIYGQKAQQNCEDTIKASIEDYIADYEHYLTQQNEKPKDLKFIQKIEEEQDEIDQIDIIIGIKRTNGKKEYLVRFKGKTGKDAKWFPKKKLRKVKEMVKEFEETYFKQSFQVVESSSGFDSTPPEQIFQENEKEDKQINQNEQQEDEKNNVKDTTQVLKKKQISQPKKSQPFENKNNSHLPESTKQSKNQVRTNKDKMTKPQNQQVKQDKQKNQKKQQNQSQVDIKQTTKQSSLEKSITPAKEVQKQKDNVQSNQQVLQKRSAKTPNQDPKLYKPISKRVKKEINEKLADNPSIKTPQQKSKEDKQIQQKKSLNQSSIQINQKNEVIPITKRQGRSKDTLHSEAQQASTTKLNPKTQKQENNDNKLSKKQQQVVVQQKNLSRSNPRQKQVSQQKQSKNVQNKQQSTQKSIVQAQTRSVRSVSVQSNKSNTKQVQQKKQISNQKNRSRSVDAPISVTLKSAEINVSMRSRNSTKTNESSQSLKKVSTKSNQQVKKSSQKQSTISTQVQKGIQKAVVISKNNLNNTNKQHTTTRRESKNSEIKNPIKINKKISKKSIKNQKEKITKKKQITAEQANPKNRSKNQKPIPQVTVRQTRQLRSKKSQDMGRRKH